MRLISIPVFIIAVLAGAILLSGQGAEKGEFSQKEIRRAQAPEFRFEDYNGKKVSLADFRGRNVIVNSWAAWCPFCVEELKDFAKLQEEFSESIAIIGIDRAESLDTAKSYTDGVGATEKLILLLDPSDSFYRSIGGFSMPETIFVNGEGEIVFHKHGPMKLEEMRKVVKRTFTL